MLNHLDLIEKYLMVYLILISKDIMLTIISSILRFFQMKAGRRNSDLVERIDSSVHLRCCVCRSRIIGGTGRGIRTSWYLGTLRAAHCVPNRPPISITGGLARCGGGCFPTRPHQGEASSFSSLGMLRYPIIGA
jgi:hypothetical protein